MSKDFDVVVIGAGPAGYPAAIRCAQLGMSVACVDAWLDRKGKPSLGGTCLNAGCIPSKALLESSEVYHRVNHDFAAHGIKVKGVEMDIAQMLKRKDEIVGSLTQGIASLFKANGIEAIHGKAMVMGSGKIEVTPNEKDGKKQSLSCKHIIIASGSEPVELRIAPFDGDRIVDSWGALEFTEAPKKLGVIGAGVIGLELGSVWRRLGSEVTVIEALPDFLPMADKQIAKEAARQFKKQGLDIKLNAKVESAKSDGKKVVVDYQEGDSKESMEFDRLIVAVGRRACTDGMFAKDSGLELDERGFVQVNDQFKTNLPSVYAVGDVIGGAMLAHKGTEEGIAVAEIIAGQKPHINYNTVPSVVYTWPELAWVGKTEEEVKASGVKYKTGSFPFAASGRAKAFEAATGTVKMIADAESDEILGVHMIGPYVSEMVAESVLAMEYAASSEDLARTMHAHPTLSEALHEAALAVDNRAIHAINKKK